MPASRHIIPLLSVALLLGCADEHAVAPDLDGEARAVVFDLRSLYQADGGASSCVSVADSLTLVIEEEGGARQTLGHRLRPEEDVVRLPVEAGAGQVTFRAEVLSNNGTQLYAGTAAAPIDADGFSVEVSLRAVNAVLKACVAPASLVPGDGAYVGVVQLINQGTRAAAWRATADPLPLCNNEPGFCLRPVAATIAPEDTASVHAIAGYGSEDRAFDVRIASEVGTLEMRFAIQDEPPQAQADTLVVLEGGAAGVDVLSNDLDPEGQFLEVVAVAPAAFGAATLDRGVVSYRANYAPVWGETSEDRFTYTVAATGLTATAEVTALINPCIRFDGDADSDVPDVPLYTENGVTAFARSIQYEDDDADFSFARVARLPNARTDRGAYLADAALELNWSQQPVRYVRFDFLNRTFLVNFAVNGAARHVASTFTEEMPVPPGAALRIEDGKFGPGTRVVLEADPDVPIERLLVGGAEDLFLVVDDVCFGSAPPGEN